MPSFRQGVWALLLALPLTPHVQARSTVSGSQAAVPLATQAALKMQVQVPRMLYFRVGTAGATVNTVQFNVRLPAPMNTLPDANIVYGGAPPIGVASTQQTDTFGASNGNVDVQLWTNNGSATIDCSGAPPTAGANQIPLSAILVTSSSAALRHPGTSLACTARTVGASGTNNLLATWRYRYNPTVLPAAGQYQTTITYTASQP